MPRVNGNIFTVYDSMEARGAFSGNPANVAAVNKDGESIYKKQLYPRMVYHPEGETEVIVPAEELVTAGGVKLVNEQKKLISRKCADATDYKAAKADGWHDHPADAIAVRAKTTGEKVPFKGAAGVFDAQATRIAELEKQLAEKSPIGGNATGSLEKAGESLQLNG